MVQRPASVVRAMIVTWVLIVLGITVTVLAVIFDEELVGTWTGIVGRSADDTRIPPSFVPVIVVLFGTYLILVLVLLAFFKGGHNWARHSLAGVFFSVAVGTLAALDTGPPTVFVVFGIVSLVLEAALIFFLYQPTTSVYLDEDARRAAAGDRA